MDAQLTSPKSTPTPHAPKPVEVNKPPTPLAFAKGMFHGHIQAGTVFPYPRANPGEQPTIEMIAQSIQTMGRALDIGRMEREKGIPPEFLEEFGRMGLFGLIIPEAYGGLGLSNTGYVQVLAELSLLEPALCATVGAHQSIGLKALLLYGNEEQKQRFLPELASGKRIAAFALTEPGAGSDAAGIQTTATLNPDGQSYTLQGSKIWITNGGIARFFTVFARTPHLDKAGAPPALTAFIVTREMPGFSNGPEERKLGMWGSSTTSLHFDAIQVPLENVLGEPGKGFKIAMGVLNNGRLGLAGACALGSRGLLAAARAHALERKQFGSRLADFGLIRQKFSQMAIETYAAEAMVRITAHLMDRGDCDYSVESAICKVFNTESEWRTANECLQIAGGNGFMAEYPYEKILRDSRIFSIWEGANEVMRLFIGLSGIQGPGEQLKQVARALREPLPDLVRSMGVLGGYGVRWLKRRVVPPQGIDGVHPALAPQARTLERMVNKFSSSVQTVLRRHGAAVIHDQTKIRRIADSAIDLFALACTLSRASAAAQTRGVKNAAVDLDTARVFCKQARRRVSENLRRLHRNEDEQEKAIAEHLYEVGLPGNALFQ